MDIYKRVMALYATPLSDVCQVGGLVLEHVCTATTTTTNIVAMFSCVRVIFYERLNELFRNFRLHPIFLSLIYWI